MGMYKVQFESGLTGVIETRDMWGDAWAAQYSGWGIVDPPVIGGWGYETEQDVLEAMRQRLEHEVGKVASVEALGGGQK